MVHSIEYPVTLVEIVVGDYLECGYNCSYIVDNHFVIVGLRDNKYNIVIINIILL